jgi:hypothetical protein
MSRADVWPSPARSHRKGGQQKKCDLPRAHSTIQELARSRVSASRNSTFNVVQAKTKAGVKWHKKSR